MTPDPKKFQAAKKRLRKHLQKIIRTHQGIIDDIASWNANRTEHAPFDAGGDVVIVKMAKEMLAMVEAEEYIPDEIPRRLANQILENSKK